MRNSNSHFLTKFLCVFFLTFLIDSYSYSQDLEIPRIRISTKVQHSGAIYRLDSVFCASKSTYRVKGYKVELHRKGKLFYQEKVKGNQFSSELKKKFLKLYADDKIILRDIIIFNDKGEKQIIPKADFHT